MPHVITRACIGTCDTACVDLCPVDCIAGPVPLPELRTLAPSQRVQRFPSIQLFIDPAECVDCGACLPECPAEAIEASADLAPDDPDRRRNAAFFEREPSLRVSR